MISSDTDRRTMTILLILVDVASIVGIMISKGKNNSHSNRILVPNNPETYYIEDKVLRIREQKRKMLLEEKMKTVTVVVPNYNSGKLIGRCIEALLEQTYKINEIIIVDDCSNDESIDIINDYLKRNENIKLIRNKCNKGVSFSRNRGIEASTCEYVMFCDGDDWYEKDAVEVLVNTIENEDADFALACYYIARERKEKIEVKYSCFGGKKILTKGECISVLPITSSAKIIKREIFIKNKIEYDESVRNCEELSVIPIAAFYAEKVIYIDKCIYNYFQRNNSASNKKISDYSFFEKTYQLFEERVPQGYEMYKLQRMCEHLLYSKLVVLIKNKSRNKEIKQYVKECNNKMRGAKFNEIISKFPLRKKVFLTFVKYKILFPLRLYVWIQEKVLGG